MQASRRKFLMKAGTIAAVVIGGAYALRSCDAIPDSAAEAWEGPEDELKDEDLRRWALSYAILAPSASNMQPWKVDLRIADDLIRLFIDEEKLLPASDPYARQTLIGLGGFVESLSIAASTQGHRAEVTYFPEGFAADHPGRLPVADIRLVADAEVKPDPLFEHLLIRRTNRQFYKTTPLSDEHRDTLNKALVADGVSADWISKQREVDAVRLAAAKAVGVEMTTADMMKESIATTRIGAGSIDDSRDGKGLNGLAIWWLQKSGRLSESNASTPGSMGYNSIFISATSHLVATPGFVLFESSGSSTEGNLATGRAYLRFNLLANSLGVSVHPVNHVLSDNEAMSETRAALYHELNKSSFRTVHMVVRVGYALEDVPAPTARRRLEDILLEDDAINGEKPEEGDA